MNISTPETQTTYALATIPNNMSTIPTFADSGASNHCVVDWSTFSEYMELAVPREGRVVSKDLVFHIVGQGTVRKTVTTNGRTAELVFQNTLHTPDLATNLISIGKFDWAGFSVIFEKGMVVFKDAKGQEILTWRGLSGMYHLDTLDEMSAP